MPHHHYVLGGKFTNTYLTTIGDALTHAQEHASLVPEHWMLISSHAWSTMAKAHPDERAQMVVGQRAAASSAGRGSSVTAATSSGSRTTKQQRKSNNISKRWRASVVAGAEHQQKQGQPA